MPQIPSGETMSRSKLLLAAVCAALAPAAQGASDEALAACRGIKDSSARLACYDALPLSPQAPAATAPRPSAPPAPAAPAAAPAPAGRATAPATPAAPASEASRFGLPATTQPTPLEYVESHIEGHFSGWYAGTRIKLANGQVWQVTDGTSRFASVDNPKVTVRRGALGSFFLDIDGVNPAPRVKRVE
jgi:hypothetical protein